MGGTDNHKNKSLKKDLLSASGRKKLFALAIVFLAAVVACLCFIAPVFSLKADDEAFIRVPKNATRQTIKDSVEKYLGKDFAEKFARASMLHGPDFSKRHGAYKIEKGDSPAAAFKKISRGAQTPVVITINGFRTMPELARRLALKLDFSADSLLSTLSAETLLSSYGLKPSQALALFLNDSYEFYWNVSPENFIKKIGKNYSSIWNESRINKAAALGLTPVEVMTIASIVDEETLKPEDKGPIGRLYINRLNKGMKLQADPTVKYAVGDFSLRRITSEHLKKESPFNTYLHKGLPPAPIKTTGVATIDSILNSKPHEYLYMCAKDDFSGYHAFAKTYEEHLKNAHAYQRALNRRNIH